MDGHHNHAHEEEHKHDLLEHIVESFFIVLLCLISLLGNGVVLKTIYFNTRLQNSFNFFVLNLAVVDICCALVAMPLTAATLISYETTASKFLCTSHAAVVTLLSIVSLCSMVLMAANRFYLVAKPTKYPQAFSKARTSKMIVFSWAVGFVFSITIYVVLIPYTQYNLSGVNCFYLKNSYVGVLVYAFLVLAPFTSLTVGFYLKTRYFMHKLKSSIAPCTKTQDQNQQSLYAEEAKTLKILLLILILSYSCLTTSSVVWIFQRSLKDFSHDLAVTGIYFQYLKNVVIPLVYIFVSRHYKKELKKTLSCKR